MEIFFGIVLLFILILIPFTIICTIRENKKYADFENNNPNYVKMRIFSRSSSSSYKIRVFSVNDKVPFFDRGFEHLYLIPGINKIIVEYKTEGEFERAAPMIGTAVGALFGVVAVKTPSPKTSIGNISKIPANVIVVTIEIKNKGYYEMKADPYKDVITVTCLEGEKHEIKTFGYSL